ncbi:DUF1444 family protein [Plantactinospora sp. KBS50]|uniref:DUF1444 family protein n=1 Tax=Plantactinospora sp. KBS50 TaxID=2024580 RepID=UPI003511C395
MKVTRTRFLPVLVSATDPQVGRDLVIDEFTDELGVAYSFGPPYGQRLVTWPDLDELGLPRRTLRRTAQENLDRALARLQVDGQPPAPMLSFTGLERGLESSALLAEEVWLDLSNAVPGDPVVGVPARDVVILTGSGSPPGLERTRRAVDRIFFAGNDHLLSRDLLVWRRGRWLPYAPEEEADPPPFEPPEQPPYDPGPERGYGPDPGYGPSYDPEPSYGPEPGYAPEPDYGRGSPYDPDYGRGARTYRPPEPRRAADRRERWLEPPERPAERRPGPRRRPPSDPTR